MKNKILIIDDSKDIIFAISEFFLMKDWEVYTALSMEEALKIVSTKELDIIIIDYHMPYINGVLGVKLIRQMNEDVSIIALTIEGLENIAEEFFLAGADDFAIKPIKVLDLYSRVNVHLNKKKEKIVSLFHVKQPGNFVQRTRKAAGEENFQAQPAPGKKVDRNPISRIRKPVIQKGSCPVSSNPR